MKIIELKIENVMGLKAGVAIKKPGDMVEITGKNGAGKSSILNSIYYALAGSRSHPSEPIRRGEKSARIRLDCGDVIVTRTFGRSKPRKEGAPSRITTRLSVENAEGAVYKSPQAMLRGMVDSISFDPLEFARSKPAEQYETIESLSGLDFTDKLKANDADYSKRRRFNRESKSSRAAADRIEIADDAPTERVSVSGLVSELGDARISNLARSRDIGGREALAAEAAGLRDQAAANSTEAARLREQANRLDEDSRLLIIEAESAENGLAVMPAAPDRIDTLAIEARIADAGGINRAVANRERRDGYAADADKAAKSAEACTERMDARKSEIRKAIEAADMPVEGLSLSGGKVVYFKIPLDQASDAEKLRVSCAIAMRGNPKLKVILIRDGSLLDSESMKVLAEMAAEHGFQVWIERVDESGTVGFYIEAGEVASTPESRQAALFD